MTLSKSEYLLFLKNPAWLWLKKHNKSKLPLPGASLQAMFDDGHLFETYAEKLFPEGVHLGFESYAEYMALPSLTAAALANGAHTIFQGRFEAENLTCIVDVLERVGENEYDLVEIKSSTSVKPEHEQDLAFQVIVLEKSGLTIRDVYVIHVNNKYVRGDAIEPEKITTRVNVTNEVRGLQDETEINIRKAFETISSRVQPPLSPQYASANGFHDWLQIFKVLNPDLPPHTIYDLYGLNPQLVRILEEAGISMIQDIADDVILTERQTRQKLAVKNGKSIIDAVNIRDFLKNIQYPLYFFDYETAGGVIPPYKGMRPYQQMPFQYSLHVIDREGGELLHREFLHRENSDPSIALLRKLKADIGEAGTVFVWNESFEKGCNEDLMKTMPEFSAMLENVNERIIDLMTPFANGWFSDKEFFGSASLKKVLPGLVPHLSYKKLIIQEGAQAQRIWMDCVFNGTNEDEKNRIMENLLEYCKLDTLAMVELYNVLRKI